MRTNNTLKKKNRNRKGIVFTLDAILAIFIAFGVFSAALFYIGQANDTQYDGQNLIKVGSSILATLEKDSTFGFLITTRNVSDLQIFLNHTENSICSNVTIFDISGNLVNNATKDNCNSTLIPISVKRVFVENASQTFYAIMDIWYNEG